MKKYFIISALVFAFVGISITLASDLKVGGGFRIRTGVGCSEPNPLTGSCSCTGVYAPDLFARPNGGGGSAGELYMCTDLVSWLQGWQGGYMIRKSGSCTQTNLETGACSCPAGTRDDIVADVEGPSDSENWIRACTKTGISFSGSSRSSYGGMFHFRPGAGCVVNNVLTGTCGCPAGYTDLKIANVTGSDGSGGEIHTCYFNSQAPPPPLPPPPATNSSIQGITLNKANNLGVSTQVTRGFTNTTFAPDYDYYFEGLLAGSYTVTAKIPSGFNAAEYSVCTNAVGTCHTPTSWIPGTSVSVNVPPSNGYVDLWWRFTPIVVPPGVEICTDGIDNDADGLIDSADPDCPPPVDVCPNISGIQTTIPPWKMIDTGGNCVPIPPPPVVTIISPKDDAVVNGPIVGGLMEVNLDWSFADPVGGTQERYRIELADTTDGTCANSYSNPCLNAVNDFKKTGGSDPHNNDVIPPAEGGGATARTVHLAPGRSYRWRVRGDSTVDKPDGSPRFSRSPSEVFRTKAPQSNLTVFKYYADTVSPSVVLFKTPAYPGATITVDNTVTHSVVSEGSKTSPYSNGVHNVKSDIPSAYTTTYSITPSNFQNPTAYLSYTAGTNIPIDITGGRAIAFRYYVAPIPTPTVDIKANGSDAPPPIPFNTAATLSWESTDATSCTASGSWSGSKTPSGSQSTGSLASSQTYTITCTGPGGISPPDSVVVNVTGAANQPPVAGAQISKDNVNWGGLITVTKGLDTTVYLSARTSSDPDGWTSANGVSSGGKCEWNRNLNQGAPIYEQTISSPTSNLGCETTVTPFPTKFNDPPDTYTYTVLRLTDNGGLQSTATVQVSVVAASIPTPTVDIKANGSNAPPPIPFNTAATLSWTSTDATSCAASGSWSGSKTPNGSQSTGPLTSSQTYTITCTGPGGISPPDSVVVNVAAPPSCTPASFVGGDVNPLSVAPGGSYTIDCDYGTFTNAIDVIPGSGSCTFDSANSFQSDTVARFNCIAGSTPGGPFPNSCTLGGKPTPPFDNYCARQDRISGRDITVNTPPAVGLFTITHSPLPEGDPATGDTTNCHDIAGNPPCPSPHFARDMRHNGSGAFSTIDVFTIHPQGTFTKDVKISVTAVKRDDFPILEPFDADGDGDLDPNFGDTRGDSAPLENGAMFFLFDGHRMRSEILRYPKRTIEFQTSYPNPLGFPREGRYIIYLDAQALCALDVPCGPIVKNEVLLVVGQTIPGWRER